MNKEDTDHQLRSLTYFAAVLVWAISTGFGLFQSVAEGANRYDTSEITIRLIQVGIALPLLFIYLSIAFAATKFLVYTSRISDAKEYRGYRLLAVGLFLTLVSYLSSGMFSLVGQKLEGSAANNFIILRNVVSIIFGLLIYATFYKGSRNLLSTLKSNDGLNKLTNGVMAMVTLVGAAYVALVFQNPYRTTSTSDLVKPTYALPDTLILTTIILPYIIMWILASLAVVNLSYYSKNVSGIIYKSLFKNLSVGFGIVITLTVFLQLIGQFSDFWASSGLQSIVLLIFLIFLALVIGYYLVGKAAAKLDRIETI